MIRYATVYYIVQADGTKEMYTTITERNCRIYNLENIGCERGVDFDYYSDLIPEDDLYY